MIIHHNKVDKDFFQRLSLQQIENNFAEIEPFFPLRTDFFHELIPLFRQINTCLIFECHIASITLTNHTLEKLLKLSLVYNEMGMKRQHFKQPTFYLNAHNKYQNSNLSQTINSCCSAGLITKTQKKYLQNEVLEQFRNGFSHSDPNRIIEPKKGKHLYSSTKPDADVLLKELVIDPMLQSQIIGYFAEAQAFKYYKNVLEITSHIQSILFKKEEAKNK